MDSPFLLKIHTMLYHEYSELSINEYCKICNVINMSVFVCIQTELERCKLLNS